MTPADVQIGPSATKIEVAPTCSKALVTLAMSAETCVAPEDAWPTFCAISLCAFLAGGLSVTEI